MRFDLLSTWGLATLLNGSLLAQQPPTLLPLPGPVRDAGTYHMATGTWSRSQAVYGLLNQDTLFRNDISANYFAAFDGTEIVTDEGRLPGAGQPLVPGQPETGTSDLYTVTGFQLAYCALSPMPVTYEVAWYHHYAPCTDPTGLAAAASLQLAGLPSGGCWLVAADLSGTTAVFDLAADGGDGFDDDDDLDDFGWSFRIDNGTQAIAGPILAGSADPMDEGNGTKFKNPASPGSGLGSLDQYWLTSSLQPSGCYSLGGGCSPCATAYSVLYGEDTAHALSACHPAQPNSIAPGGGLLESTAGFGTSTAAFRITRVPDQPGILYSGPDGIDVPFGCGRRCVGGTGILRYGPFSASGNQLSVTIDMSLSSNDNIQYWFRDPAFAATCGDVFNLTNALGL